MKFLKYCFIFFIFTFFSSTFANDNLFKERLKKAKKGDFIVFEYNKLYSTLSVFDIDYKKKKIILEEITISKDSFNKKISFRDWIEKKAINHTSWTMYEIDLNQNKIIDAYSVARNSFIDLTNSESIITKLLDLEINKLPDRERKKIGPAPLRGEVDRRSNWQPMKFIDGKRIKRAKLNAFRAIWPEDSSELSLKTFNIYFDDSFVFPYFMEINNGHMSYMIKAVDSGKELISTTNFFPKRAAEITEMQKLANTLLIKVKNANHFENFNLFAIDITRVDKIIHPLEFEMEKNEKEVVLKVDLKNLNKIFEKNHKYKMVITPYFQKDIFIESLNTFVWK